MDSQPVHLDWNLLYCCQVGTPAAPARRAQGTPELQEGPTLGRWGCWKSRYECVSDDARAHIWHTLACPASQLAAGLGTQMCLQMCKQVSPGRAGTRGRVCTERRARQSWCARVCEGASARSVCVCVCVCFSHGFISEDCFRAWSQVLSSSGNYAFLGGFGERARGLRPLPSAVNHCPGSLRDRSVPW